MTLADEKRNPDPLYTASEAAVFLGLESLKHPEHAVLRLARIRRLRSVKVSDRVMIPLSALRTYLAGNVREAVS